VLVPTLAVLTVKVAVLEPAGTVMLEGTAATPGGKLISVTSVSFEEDGFTSVTMPLIELPPTIDLRERLTEERAGAAGSTSRLANFVTPAYSAEIVTEAELATFVVVIGK
jgi:hypothetical protein